MPYKSKTSNTKYKKINSMTLPSYPSSSSESTRNEKVKSLDIVMYSSPTCFYCVHFKQLLKDENLDTYITVIEDPKEIPSNVEAFPYLVSKTTKKYIVGVQVLLTR